jgi:hypothetical protein
MAEPTVEQAAVIDRAFGAENRSRLLEKWFSSEGAPTPSDAWKHVYRLLLWIDRTTGLAHCYESDKSQPGKPWYPRSVAFHGWLSDELDIPPLELGGRVDWLFQRAIEDLARRLVRQRERASELGPDHQAPFGGKEFPIPGDDPELVSIISRGLARYLTENPSTEVWREISERIQAHYGQDNKRKNLVGEGFEDVIAAIVSRIPGHSLEVSTRKSLEDVPGFHRPRAGEKGKKVDVVVIDPETQFRTLVTIKWSVRADREEQFESDFKAYERLESAGNPFGYALVTNEFDPARLLAACDKPLGNQKLFSDVVHVNPEGVLATYGPSPRRSAKHVVSRIAEGRLSSLAAWLLKLTGVPET